MKRVTYLASAAALVVGAAAGALVAQQALQPQPYYVGNPLGLPVNPAPNGTFEATSPNVKVFGAIYSAESCSYDPQRGVIVVPNRGVPQNVQTNNAWVSFVNHDGSGEFVGGLCDPIPVGWSGDALTCELTPVPLPSPV